MSRPIKRIHNLQTDEIIDREMTAAEYKVYEAEQVAEATAQLQAEAQATAKAELLARLGITADEAKLLLG